jgi:hypothetical protein
VSLVVVLLQISTSRRAYRDEHGQGLRIQAPRGERRPSW